jgi:hypothetical protein
MKIYIGHSRDFDYINELYLPLRQSALNSIMEIILPHESDGQPFNSKDDFKTVDFMVAEISYPSTGLGIEIGYADIYQIPIIIAYKKGFKVSGSAKSLGSHMIEYANIQDLVKRLTPILKG